MARAVRLAFTNVGAPTGSRNGESSQLLRPQEPRPGSLTTMSSAICFVCSTPVSSIEELGATSRASCVSCKGRARLLAGGAVLREILESSEPDPLEGSGLNVILNPLEIDGLRCGADFAAGGFAVFEEVYPASDHFDFLVQHWEPWAGAMRVLKLRSRSDPGEPNEVAGLLRDIQTRMTGVDLEWLLRRWVQTLDASDALAKRSPIRHADDVYRVLDSLPDRSTLPSDAAASMFARLASLAVSSASTRQKVEPMTKNAWSQELDGLSIRVELPPASPGETIQAKLWFKNSGAQPRHVCLIRGDFFRGFQSKLSLPGQLRAPSPPHGIVVTEKDFPEIAAGAEVSFSQSFAVPKDTTVGEHLVTWEYSNKIDQWKGGAQTLDGPTLSLFGGGKIPGIWLGKLSTEATLLVR